MKNFRIPFAITLLSVVLWSCEEKKEVAATTETKPYVLDKETKKKLAFATPTQSMVVEGIPLTGAVEANPDNVVQFVSLVSGVISKTYFSLGDKVTKGQVLAELRSTELSGLKAELKNTKSQINVANQSLKSVQSMFADGVASQKEVLQAQSELNILTANKDRVEANLNLFSASAEQGVFQIKAPATGFVTSKTIATGSQIAAESEPLFTISNLNDVWVMVNIYATNIENIAIDMDVNIKTLSYPDLIYKGKVAAITQVFDTEAKVLKARIVIKNADLKLKPGMIVDVIALNNKNVQAIAIPISAMIFDNNQNFVVLYKSDSQLEIRKVEILTSSNGNTFIADGIDLNDTFITKNQMLIYEQLKNFQN